MGWTGDLSFKDYNPENNLSVGTPYSQTGSMSMSMPSSTGAGMDPLTLSALISTGGSLLSGLLGGSSKKQQAKEDAKVRAEERAAAEQLRKRKIADTQSLLKPTEPRYGIENGMSVIDEVLKKVLLGNSMDTVGDKAGAYGIDYASLLERTNQALEQARTPEATGSSATPMSGLDMRDEALRQKRLERRGMGGGLMSA